MTTIPKLLKEVEAFYIKEGRSHLPWRKTKDPYKILVSEVMLQQTQVDRVLPYYKNFLKEFPTVQVLAKAPLNKVLKAWQGLGYNRRGRYLQLSAQKIIKEHAGRFPKTVSALQELPGIGPYTAGAIAAFAYNQPQVFIETNIRTVFIYFCFPKPEKNILSQKSWGLPSDPQTGSAGQIFAQEHFSQVSDAELLPLIEKALAKTKLEPREFYAALMDYGSYLKRQGVKLNKQSKHYIKQSKFEGSARQLRGAILRELLKKPQTAAWLTKNLSRKSEEVSVELARLQKEGMVSRYGRRYRLPV